MTTEGSKDDVVDVDALEFADDIEEIVISDYSDDGDVEIVENNSQNTSNSELKISNVISCSGLDFGIEENIGNTSVSENEINHNFTGSVGVFNENQPDDTSSEFNFSNESSSEDIKMPKSKSLIERRRRTNLRSLYLNLWKAISSEKSMPKCSRADLLTTSYDMIKKLTIEGRKLEYSSELFMQSNYRLKRRFKRLKKKLKHNDDSRASPNPGKVVTSRASI